MPEQTIEELGPVDYLVVEFPPGRSNFTGEMAKELSSLVEAELIQILDLLVLHKNDDGSIEALELDELEPVDDLRSLETQIAEVLAADDVANLAASMEPGTTAGVLVWENTWAAPFASAARRSGGQLIANGRIPIQAILASLETESGRRLTCQSDLHAPPGGVSSALPWPGPPPWLGRLRSPYTASNAVETGGRTAGTIVRTGGTVARATTSNLPVCVSTGVM
jgi:hypothetical protein